MARYAYPITAAIDNNTVGVASSAKKAAEMIEQYAEKESHGALKYEPTLNAEEMQKVFEDSEMLEVTLQAFEHGSRRRVLDRTLRVRSVELNKID